jgi:hypothetical protein
MAIIVYMQKFKRVIMRIDVSPGVSEALEAVVARVGSANISVQSRVIDWLCAQDERVQATVLGLYPGTKQPHVAKMALRRMAEC